MSDSALTGPQTAPAAAVVEPPTPRLLHRLAEVRRCQGISRRKLARWLNTDVATIKQQEQPTADLPLSTLYAWQAVLEAPIAELLVESNDPVSVPVAKRAQLVRLMKTVQAILERTQQPSIRFLAQALADGLCEVMPELKTVTPWHAVGRRRTSDELGQAAAHPVHTDGHGLPTY